MMTALSGADSMSCFRFAVLSISIAPAGLDGMSNVILEIVLPLFFIVAVYDVPSFNPSIFSLPDPVISGVISTVFSSPSFDDRIIWSAMTGCISPSSSIYSIAHFKVISVYDISSYAGNLK